MVEAALPHASRSGRGCSAGSSSGSMRGK